MKKLIDHNKLSTLQGLSPDVPRKTLQVHDRLSQEKTEDAATDETVASTPHNRKHLWTALATFG